MTPGRSRARSSNATPRFVVCFLLVLMLSALVAGFWTEWRIESVAGQTIPWPTRTGTATPPGFVTSTPTWTPRPTWTRIPTIVEPTLTPGLVPATATAVSTVLAPGATLTMIPAGSATPSRSSTPTQTVAPVATPSVPVAVPIPLAFEVALMPQVAGPGDEVSFIVQVANLGYDPLEAIRVVAMLGDVLSMEDAECGDCTIEISVEGVHILLGTLDPGEQVVFPVEARVVDDAWPGQMVKTEWTLRSPSQPAQVRGADLTLPWAPLPATGSSH